MSDTDKQTLIDLYEISIANNFKKVHQIFCKLTSLEYFELSKRIVLVIVEGSLYMVYHNNAHIFSLNLGEAKQRFDTLKKKFSKKKGKY